MRGKRGGLAHSKTLARVIGRQTWPMEERIDSCYSHLRINTNTFDALRDQTDDRGRL
jgi:hypothetical protein